MTDLTVCLSCDFDSGTGKSFNSNMSIGIKSIVHLTKDETSVIRTAIPLHRTIVKACG